MQFSSLHCNLIQNSVVFFVRSRKTPIYFIFIFIYLLSALVSSPRVRNLVQPEWVLQGADDMFVAVTSSYLPPLLSLYEIPAILIEI